MDASVFLIIIFLLLAGSLSIASVKIAQVAPIALREISDWRLRSLDKQRTTLKESMLYVDFKRIALFNIAIPLVFTVIGVFVGVRAGSVVVGGLVGFAIGFLIPSLTVKNMVLARKSKFNSQITDALMILSSCLKGGLSLLQAIEAVAEELPAPISQEFGVILRENKMGVPLEESFERLNKRMPSEELNLLTTAILVARETGGDITKLFTVLIDTIRAKLKIADSVKTLTIQGKIQGIVMTFLPVVFVIMVCSFQKNYFDIMLNDSVGRALLIYAVISEIAGAILIRLFSKVNV